jgi:GntR family transcriptional repressor for pyruvate dehydrogenase complex
MGNTTSSAVDYRGVFKSAKHVRSFDQIVEQIRAAVLSGRVEPGQRLPNERELCQIFGVSRSTLREALRVLEAFGVIQIRLGSAGGIFASEPNEDQVTTALEAFLLFRGATANDLVEFRTSFEAETARWAALRADQEDIERLESVVGDFRSALKDEQIPWDTFVEIDIRFHDAIARASKNRVRVAIMLAIHRALQRASSSLAPYASAEVRRSIARELSQITDAIRRHDPSLAQKRMKRHVKKFSELETAHWSTPTDGEFEIASLAGRDGPRRRASA